jgi:PilZ domain.
MMALETQTCWDSPKFTIDCVLANVSRQLEADGCVLECLEGGHKLTTPDHLRAGDFVKVQLWLEGEEAFIDIRLAEVRRVHKHWITVEVIRVSPNDRMRLKRFIDAPATMHIEKPALIDHLLIRA